MSILIKNWQFTLYLTSPYKLKNMDTVSPLHKIQNYTLVLHGKVIRKAHDNFLIDRDTANEQPLTLMI